MASTGPLLHGRQINYDITTTAYYYTYPPRIGSTVYIVQFLLVVRRLDDHFDIGGTNLDRLFDRRNRGDFVVCAVYIHTHHHHQVKEASNKAEQSSSRAAAEQERHNVRDDLSQ